MSESEGEYNDENARNGQSCDRCRSHGCRGSGRRFQTATIIRNQAGSLSGGSQILPDGRVIITNTPVRDLLRIVYDVPDFVIVGAPEWFASERYDITAQAAGSRREIT